MRLAPLHRVLRGLFCLAVIAGVGSEPLHSGSLETRKAAINRALHFIYKTAADEAQFAEHGHDLLWCFYSISHTSSDPELSQTAARMGRELARRWRQSHQHVPLHATAMDIYRLIAGAYAADRLGLPDPQFKAELLKAVPRFTAKDYLGFDAAHGPPNLDDPKRYDKFTDALIRSYFADTYGVRLGASYREVVRWLPLLRPYTGYDEDTEFDIFYTVTHVVYTLDGYHERRIAPSFLPQEFQFIRRKLEEAMLNEDPEMVGEGLDCLKAAGFENDPQVAKGMRYLISSQRPDGTWGDDDDDVYTAYHAAWTAIDGLRDYHFHGRVTRMPGTAAGTAASQSTISMHVR
jgi:hypothetical protein